MISIVASLSSITSSPTSRSKIMSQMCNAGISRGLRARLIDTISASGVEWETQLCFLVLAARGIKDPGLTRATNAPEADRRETLSQAKSASA
jgi:hypothetical protein